MKNRETAYFAGGCFWCITPTYQELDGVYCVTSGYSGGMEENPEYLDVKNQKTGHRETICVEFDPDVVSYETLLELFLCSVDPFDPEGQYIDRGFSYTLAVYYVSEEQRRAAEAGICRLEEASGQRPCISLEHFRSFYPAEEEHQDYYRKHPIEFEKELIASGRKKVPSEAGRLQ